MTKERLAELANSYKSGLAATNKKIEELQKQAAVLNQQLQQAFADRTATFGALQAIEGVLKEESAGDPVEAKPDNVVEFPSKEK